MRALFIAIVCLCAFTPSGSGQGKGLLGLRDLRGQVAPDFRLPLLVPGARDEGYRRRVVSPDSLQLSSLRGEVVVLNVWFTTCGPCVAENPTFDLLARRFESQGVRFIGVIYNESVAPVEKYMKQARLSYPQVFELGSDFSGKYGIAGAPHTFIIDEAGVVRDQYFGGLSQQQELIRMIRKAKPGLKQ